MKTNAFDLLERVRAYSPRVANFLTDQLTHLLIPLTRGMGIQLKELTPTRCEVFMPLKRKTRNHLKSVYFGAQMTLADITVGVLLFQRFPPGPFGGVIKRVEADFTRKAKGHLRCIGELTPELVDLFETVRHNESGKIEDWVPLEIVDQQGKLITNVRCLVAIKRFD